ncbi:unnamed protein product [Staurois parvus]|uniref:ATP synthase F0 subunit 8 n=1 Tax=Staurois parvus TaxID=386267 RepID=A0ABN9E2W9_9NEOB|nr:unnamed protein product [Staurois parvus]
MGFSWYLFISFFIGFFWVWARIQGPHNPLLPRGPMTCQSTDVRHP